MPIVYVHGVSVRKEHDYYLPSEQTRNGLFRQVSLPKIVAGIDAVNVTIRNPYWGGDAADFAWKLASLPREQVEAFGSSDSIFARLAEEALADIDAAPGAVSKEKILLTLARKNLARAADLLWSAAGMAEGHEDLGDVLAASGAKAQRYAAANPHPAWLAQMQSDSQFADRLLAEIDSWNEAAAAASPPAEGEAAIESFGIGDILNRVVGAAKKLGNAATAAVTNPIVRMVRPALNEMLSVFVGDIFCYLRAREKLGTASPIVKVVSDDIQAAFAKRTASDPLIVVGHSMGGIISYDVLTHFLKDKVQCDVLLTVGSQVALFEELKLYMASDPAIKAPARVKRPANILRWLNVFDHADVLSYQTGPVFEGVEDHQFATGQTVLESHGAYLLQPRFHQRLNARLRRLS